MRLEPPRAGALNALACSEAMSTAAAPSEIWLQTAELNLG